MEMTDPDRIRHLMKQVSEIQSELLHLLARYEGQAECGIDENLWTPDCTGHEGFPVLHQAGIGQVQGVPKTDK